MKRKQEDFPMLGSEKMPLKTFWETVEQRLAACSADELRAILRAMAQEIPPTGRQTFLEKLKPVEETTITVKQAIEQEALLTDIDDLIQELEATMKEADYWEERSEWDDHYDDEDSLGPYEEFVELLAGLFDRTEATFDYGHLPLARAAYQKLFEAVNLEDDYGRGVHASDLTGVDFDEAQARYLRAVYETEPSQGRAQALFEQMQQVRSGLMRGRLMLEDLIQISPQPLPDREQFLTDWIAFLRTRSGSNADTWLREAVRLSQGTPGLAVLAQTEGQTRPRAYLDWFTALEQEGQHRQVLRAAQEALQRLPAQLPIRAAIADHLCTAAVKLNETEAWRAGRWAAFLAKPTLSRLLDLWDTAPAGAERTAQMRQAVQHVRDYLAHPPGRQSEVGWAGDDLEQPARIDPSVLAHACLLAEELEAAHQLAAAENVLGWSRSGNPQGLVMPSCLVLLSGRAPDALPSNLAQLWAWGLQASVGFWGGGGQQDPVLKRLEQAYAEQFARLSLSEDRQQEILAWCVDVAQRRVDAIVSGQHRGSYNKAAVVTTACTEVLRLRGDRPAADSLLNEVRNRFPRHRAFQTELKTAIQEMERSLR
ncbi:MAG: hypothetical protein AB1801_16710 [Chloroflexota bacterium]